MLPASGTMQMGDLPDEAMEELDEEYLHQLEQLGKDEC